eukprot:m.241379 g.241379  ORF g.241379 m.241379 type:complete len:829 (-) comp33773_c2_seq1:1694-4180(-)
MTTLFNLVLVSSALVDVFGAPTTTDTGIIQSYAYYNDTDFNGYNIGGVKTVSMDACAAACNVNPLCVCASWNGPDSFYHDNTCNLHCSTAGKKSDKGEIGVIVRPQATMCKTPSPPTPPVAGLTPPGWKERFDQGQLLISSVSDQGAQIGNGYSAFFIGQGYECISGLFNGHLSYTMHTTSHRAKVPSVLTTAKISSMNSMNLPQTAAALDLEQGVYMVAAPSGVDGDNVTSWCISRLYAHRALAHLLVFEVTCNNTLGNKSLVVDIASAPAAMTLDLKIQPFSTTIPNVKCFTGSVYVPETNESTKATIGVCSSDMEGQSLTVKAGAIETVMFARTVYSNIDTDRNNSSQGNPVEIAESNFKSAVAQGADALWASHVSAMSALTQPGVEVGGNIELGRVINATLNALLATVRQDVIYSSSPGGLATNAYNGHTFWDVCTWMWPTWLLWHPEIAKAALQYRVNRLPQARENAKLHGFDGAMFPWESAYSGTEVDPAQGTTTEEHLQGDIAFAFRQYYEATADVAWLKSDGFEVIEAIARFWASKAVKNTDETYSIPHIMGPDEYHGDVTDSVYCNVVAQLSLQTAHSLAIDAGVQQNDTFKEIADGLVILFDKGQQYHPEFQGYSKGTKVKQADTILLGYPLLYSMPVAVRKNDVDYYTNITDPNGPAMTWSMTSIAYRDLGETNKAALFFERGYKDNSLGNYHDWHEVVGSAGADNFITGAGGFMQSVFAGYGGIRFVNGTLLLQQPSPLPNSTMLLVRQFKFLGSVLNLRATTNTWSVWSEGAPAGVPPLQVVQDGTHHIQPLTQTPIEFPSGTSAVVSVATTQVL